MSGLLGNCFFWYNLSKLFSIHVNVTADKINHLQLLPWQLDENSCFSFLLCLLVKLIITVHIDNNGLRTCVVQPATVHNSLYYFKLL